MQSIVRMIDLYNEDFLLVGVSLLSLTFICFLFLWQYNRRKFQQLKHQLPANVVQGYLDSIIQNSHSLKSSLFRGADVPLSDLKFAIDGETGAMLSGGGIGGSLVKSSLSLAGSNDGIDFSQKNAEISALRSQVSEKEGMITDLEEKITNTLTSLRELEDAYAKLQEENKVLDHGAAKKAGSVEGDNIVLEEITKERDLLREKLKEYEFIENDLAEIPRLQRTVTLLKKSLKEMGVDPEEKIQSLSKTSNETTENKTASIPVIAEPTAIKLSTDQPVAVAATTTEMDQDEAAMAELLKEAAATPVASAVATDSKNTNSAASVKATTTEEDLLKGFEELIK